LLLAGCPDLALACGLKMPSLTLLETPDGRQGMYMDIDRAIAWVEDARHDDPDWYCEPSCRTGLICAGGLAILRNAKRKHDAGEMEIH
jgi:hypothetical protein